MHRRRISTPRPKGPVAWSPKSWDDDFDVFFCGPGEVRQQYEVAGRFAVVDVAGVLTQASQWWGDDYASIKARVAAAIASEQPEVMLRISSPGGDFAGCLDLARELRGMARAASKRLTAFTDSQAASAAYAIATAADEIVLTESAMAGSVGVWAPLVDQVAADKAMGLNVQIVASGSAKADRNPHVAITEEAYARMLAQVDDMADLFFELVSEHRGMPASRAKSLQGAEFLGAKAIAVGFADRIATFDQLVSGTTSPNGSPMATSKKSFDSAKEALRAVVDDEKASEDEREKARKSLRALEAEPENKEEGKAEDGEQKKDDKKDEEAAAKAKAEEEKKKDEEAKAKASALAANSLQMAEELQALKAKDAARDAAEAKAKDESARAALFAKRPDFSEAQRATLALLPIAALEKAVSDWPRANAQPGAAAAAMTPGVSGGEKRAATYMPNLTPDQKAMLDRTAGSKSAAGPKAASMAGTMLEMPLAVVSQEDALARIAELEKETV